MHSISTQHIMCPLYTAQMSNVLLFYSQLSRCLLHCKDENCISFCHAALHIMGS